MNSVISLAFALLAGANAYAAGDEMRAQEWGGCALTAAVAIGCLLYAVYFSRAAVLQARGEK